MGRDAAIHRVSRCAVGDCGSLRGSQWIATGYALAMTRVRSTGSRRLLCKKEDALFAGKGNFRGKGKSRVSALLQSLAKNG
jgi:hypothetical protein